MNESIHKYFRVGTILWMSYPELSLMDALRKVAADDYFDAVEIKDFGADNDAAKALIEQSHLDAYYSGNPTVLGGGYNPNSLDENVRLAAVEAICRDIDTAAYLGAKGYTFVSGKWEEENKEAEYAQLLKTTDTVCTYAEEKGIAVDVEVFDYDMDKAVLIGPAPLALRYANDVRKKHKDFGLLVDLSHFPTTYETSDFVVSTLKDVITHLHFGNAVVEPGCDSYGDCHPRMGYPHSANDVPELTDYLSVLRRDGLFRAEDPLVLSMEIRPRSFEDSDAVMGSSKRCLNRAWALLDSE